MNLIALLLPKKEVDFLYTDFTIRQAMERMRKRGYSAVPIIERETGKYVTSITDGDILRYLVEHRLDFDDLEKTPLMNVPIARKIEAVPWFADEDQLYSIIINQNYVPIVDDMQSFIGIVTRQKFLRAYVPEKTGESK